MKPLRILIVEDDADIRCLLTELLTDSGFETSPAENGAAALKVLKGSALPDLILLDLMMPVMDGFTFRNCQTLDPELAQIPVIIMTADGSQAEVESKTHACAYLKKPLDIHEVVAAITKHAKAL